MTTPPRTSTLPYGMPALQPRPDREDTTPSFFVYEQPEQETTTVMLGLANGQVIDILSEAGRMPMQDIVTALEREHRFAGHTTEPWTVASHSILCYRIACQLTTDPKERLSVLLHDITEAFVKDMPRPLKHTPGMQWYRDVERRVQDQLEFRWGFDLGMFPLVKEIDELALCAEAPLLQNGRLWDGRQPEPRWTAHARCCMSEAGRKVSLFKLWRLAAAWAHAPTV